jgi:NhaC family Na+:H+ antiporter
MMQTKMKQPSLLSSILLLVVIFFFLIYGIMFSGLQVELVLIFSGVVAAIFAVIHGNTFENITTVMSEKIKKGLILFLVLYSVGLVIGTWIMSGTIPYLIYFGLELIQPQYLYAMAFIATAIVSVCIGSSFSSTGTIGVALMGIAGAMDVNLAVTAGAVISGAYFGDKLSPLSDTVIMSSLITGVNVYEHIRHLLYTTVPSMVIALTVFFIVGFNIDTAGGITGEINDIATTLQQLFNMNVLLLLPPIIIIAGSLMKKPVLVVLFLSSAVAMLLSLFLQQFPLRLVLEAGVEGFNTDMFSGIISNFDPGQISDKLTELLNMGGISSMSRPILTIFCAFFFASALESSQALKVVISKTLSYVKTATNTILISLVSGLALILSTGNGTVVFFLMKDLFGEEYAKKSLDQLNLSRAMEDAGAIPEVLFPWTSAAIYMSATVGVSTMEYAPWTIFNMLGIVFSALLAILGPYTNWFGIKRTNKHKQSEESS